MPSKSGNAQSVVFAGSSDPQKIQLANGKITTLDGMKYKKSRIKPWFWFTKIWYFVCIIAVWGYLAFQIWQCFQKYQQWPTYYNTTIVEQKYAPLPDITICAAENHGLKREVLKANGLTSKS